MHILTPEEIDTSALQSSLLKNSPQLDNYTYSLLQEEDISKYQAISDNRKQLISCSLSVYCRLCYNKLPVKKIALCDNDCFTSPNFFVSKLLSTFNTGLE